MKGPLRLKHVTEDFHQKLKLRWILLLVLVLLIIILAWPNPASGAYPGQASTPTYTPVITTTPTPIPVEFLQTADQTSGIIFGSIVLVLIIVGGTLVILRTRNGKAKS